MKLHILAVGRIGQGPEAALVERYRARCPWPMSVTELPDTRPAAPAPAPHSRTVVLDETGRPLTSRQLSVVLTGWRDEGVREARFLIGGADGHSAAVRAGADLLLSFGAATWPHLLVRAMLAEQLYRAVSISTNHPYHRDGSKDV